VGGVIRPGLDILKELYFQTKTVSVVVWFRCAVVPCRAEWYATNKL